MIEMRLQILLFGIASFSKYAIGILNLFGIYIVVCVEDLGGADEKTTR